MTLLKRQTFKKNNTRLYSSFIKKNKKMGLTSQLRHVFHSNSFTFQRRNLWGWLNSITNK